ncbi:MAG: DNA mismatch repair protein MutS, partial [Clostridia bacterium]|nr:DNA mismatch repair protein MutS [Clostridia bacterium]
VIRVITPGTVIDSSMLDENANTYIMSVFKNKDSVAYAYTDISTGEFCVGFSKGDKILSYLNDQIMRIMPAEIIANEDMMNISENLPAVKSNSVVKFSQYYEWAYNYSTCEKAVLDNYGIQSIVGYDFAQSDCIIAIGALLQYIKETQKRTLKHFKLPKVIHDENFMYIDTNTRRNLELEQTMRDGVKVGSLLWVLDKTKTGGGARALRRLINQPIQDINEINQRLNIVEAIKNNHLVRASLLKELAGVRDIERIVGKLSYGTITPKECVAIMETLEHTPIIKSILENSGDENLINLSSKINNFEILKQRIQQTINSEPPTVLKDGGFIAKGFNAELDRLTELFTKTKELIESMTLREREETGIKNLKIGYNRVFGYYIEVGKQYAEQVPFNYIRKQTVSNNERYITEELKKFENEVLTAQESAIKLELEIYENFKLEMFEYHRGLQELAQIISLIDAFLSLAIVADENNYVKPSLTNSSVIKIKNGRHPVIEKIQRNNEFIANDCLLDGEENRTMILTGPNMAGKSTYMRQVALITFMAHIGSFVPADEAEISIVDRIFTRIGASDDLAVGQSTFMVEMVEVSNILHYATNKSLIILDEVGRGTSTHDGLSIAWSVVEYLSEHLSCKTLFATHYHELMQLENLLKGVKNYCISIKEISGELVFLRKIMRGSATRSYGIEVANLAGIPASIISRAKAILKDLEDGEFNEISQIQADKSNTTVVHKKSSEIIDILKSCDINNISPMIAFDTLTRLIELAKND